MKLNMLHQSLAIVLLAACIPGAALAAEATVGSTRDHGVWSYRVENRATNPVSIVTLSVRGPVRVVGTPKGWKADTDGCSVVSWTSVDGDIPAKGGKLKGFAIKSTVKTQTRREMALVQWDTKNLKMGTTTTVLVDAPDNGLESCAQD